MRIVLLFVVLLVPMAAQVFNTTPALRHTLSNEGVVMLAKAGFDELFIIELIHNSRTRFDTSVEGLVALKQAGLSEDLIRVMAIPEQQDRNYPPPQPQVDAAPAFRGLADADSARRFSAIVEKHWWGYRWVRTSP
jgi:hypothetical protein